MTHGPHGSLFREIRRLDEDGAIGCQSGSLHPPNASDRPGGPDSPE
jgi:hypothetical protein